MASHTLVVILHGMATSPAHMADVQRAIEEAHPGAEFLIPQLPTKWRSNANPVAVTADVVQQIDARFAALGPGEGKRVVLVGYSVGAVLIRKAFVYACGEYEDAPFEKEYTLSRDRRSWADRVERIILLAGINRGWTLAPNIARWKHVALWLLGTLARLVGVGNLIFSVARGAPYITQLRIQWLSMVRHWPADRDRPLTVQLLGTVDDVVAPDDNVDVVTGGDFVYFDVRDTGHYHVTVHDAAHPERRELLIDALRKDPAVLRSESHLQPEDLLPAIDREARRVVFVVHGIRDYGFWTSRVARYIERAGRLRGEPVAAITSSYGYFAMLPFLLKYRRQRNVQWFMDQYTEALVRFPNADEFSFVGHSNGTYLLAEAMKSYPACRFKNVVLAGSVVRREFDWPELVAKNRVANVLNYVADNDWVVALFPRLLSRFGADVGGGGYDGFAQGAENIMFVKGAHSAALREFNWDAIAQFVLEGKLSGRSASGHAVDRRPWATAWPALAPVVWLILLAIIAFPLLLWTWLSFPAIGALHAISALAYWWVVLKVLTRA